MSLPVVELSNPAEASPFGQEHPTPTAVPQAPRGSIPGVIVVGGAHGSVAAARSLGRRGIPVWFAGDGHPIAGFSRYVRRRFTWNRADPEAALAMLCRLAQEEGAEGWVLFPSGDPALQLVSQHWQRLSEHFRLFTMPWETLQQLNEKSRLYRLAEEVGTPFPRSYHPETGDLPGPDGFPVIVKPVSNEKVNALTRVKAWRVDTAAELPGRFAEAIALMGPGGVLVQEMIPGGGERQFSYAGIWDRGREAAFLTARRTRQYPIDFGLTSSFVETMPVPEIAKAARRILERIGFHGLVEIEFKFDARDQRYKVLDANTRAWAWIGISASTGIDFPYLAYRLAIGQDLPEGLVARPARWLHPTRNMLSLLQQWRREGRPPATAWRSMSPGSTLATFALDDPLPGIVDLPIQALRLLRRRGRGKSPG